ncbi:protein SET DOMAIN GROUP 41 isoform X4 [Triticum aestivum]|uniref:protein SET DOMAIN GROUP 41 isoform X4 n=1 Tax=Triticum aestivum TaxID=4565 RepID=UPI001D021F59|nr:protein SET DOMAIN GROUP 41-like isoform X4 [Triticum aestivum]
MAMEMRARESIGMSEDLTRAIAPYATALHDMFLHSHCSSCFRKLPLQPPCAMSCILCCSVQYCCSDCLSSDHEMHSSSGECCFFADHLKKASPSYITEGTSDVRASLRLLYFLEMHGLVSSDSINRSSRIGGLSTIGIHEVLEEGGEVAERILKGSMLMSSARKMRKQTSVVFSNGLIVEIMALWAVMINSVEVQITEEWDLGIAVYGPSFSWFNHSCFPNASYRFELAPPNEDYVSDKSEYRAVPASKGVAPDAWHTLQFEEGSTHALGKYGPRVVVRCIKPINKGDEVCITYIDLLQTRCDFRNLNSPENAFISRAVEGFDDILQQAISEYSLGDDPKACCAMIESLLSENLMGDLQQVELSRKRHILHPLHHICLRAYMTLASAYRFRALEFNTDGFKGENSAVSFKMTKAAVAYSFLLAGATHHLFLSERSFMTSLAHFLLSAGRSMLDFVECVKGERRKNVSQAKFSSASCSASSGTRDSMQYHQFRSTCEEFGKRMLSLSLQCWPFLVQSSPCLEKIKNPIDFSWLGTAIFQSLHLSEVDSANLSCTDGLEILTEEQKGCILNLAICCITFCKYLANICYGPQHYLANHAKDLLEGINLAQ